MDTDRRNTDRHVRLLRQSGPRWSKTMQTGRDMRQESVELQTLISRAESSLRQLQSLFFSSLPHHCVRPALTAGSIGGAGLAAPVPWLSSKDFFFLVQSTELTRAVLEVVVLLLAACRMMPRRVVQES